MKFKVTVNDKIKDSNIIDVNFILTYDDGEFIDSYVSTIYIEREDDVININKLKIFIVETIIDLISLHNPTKMKEGKYPPSIASLIFQDNDDNYHFYNFLIDSNTIDQYNIIDKTKDLIINKYNLNDTKKDNCHIAYPTYSYPDQQTIYCNRDIIVNFENKNSDYNTIIYDITISEVE